MTGDKSSERCAYCGSDQPTTGDHVVSRALYPLSKATSPFQRIKVPACEPCNKRFMDAEPHFRNILLIAGETNAAVRELWEGPARRSFTYADGKRRARDLVAQMVPIETAQG